MKKCALYLVQLIITVSMLQAEMAEQDSAKLLYEKAHSIYDQSPEEALALLDTQIRISENAKDMKMLMKGHYMQGYIYLYGFGNYAGALNHYYAAWELSYMLEDKKEILRCLQALGKVYYDVGDRDNARLLYEEVLAIAEEAQDSVTIATFSTAIGNCYFYTQKAEEAESSFLNAIEIFEALDDKIKAAEVYNYMGKLYRKLAADHQKAREYYQLANSILDETNTINYTRGEILNNIGNSYYEDGAISLAEEYFKQSIAYNLEHGYDDVLAVTFNNLADIELEQGNKRAAITYFTSAEEHNSHQVLEIQYHRTLSGLRKVHGIIGNYKQAMLYSTKLENGALELIKLREELQQMMNIYKLAVVRMEHEKVKRDVEVQNRILVDKVLMAGLLFLAIIGGLFYSSYFKRWKRLRQSVDNTFEKQQRICGPALETVSKLSTPNPSWFQ